MAVLTRATSAPRATRNRVYAVGPRRADRTKPCPTNRNGIWPPIYERQWAPLPARSLSNKAQVNFQRCVFDATANGELHRTTSQVVLMFSKHSDDWLGDVFVSQRTVADALGLAESTVCHHVAIAKRLGWFQVRHRNKVKRGDVVAQSNITRFHLPQQWADKLAADAKKRASEKSAELARKRSGSRTTPRTDPARRGNTGSEDNRPLTSSPESHAAEAGAAEARTAATYRAGEEHLQDLYQGKPGLYEAAWNQFNETWKTVRLNE